MSRKDDKGDEKSIWGCHWFFASVNGSNDNDADVVAVRVHSRPTAVDNYFGRVSETVRTGVLVGANFRAVSRLDTRKVLVGVRHLAIFRQCLRWVDEEQMVVAKPTSSGVLCRRDHHRCRNRSGNFTGDLRTEFDTFQIALAYRRFRNDRQRRLGFRYFATLVPEGGGSMRTVPKVLLSLIALVAISALKAQESWKLRFSVREGVPLDWHIKVTTRKVVNKSAEVEVTELWVREQVDRVLTSGNLIWSSQVKRCVINGEVVPVDKMEVTVSELTPLGHPTKSTVVPAPSLNQLDDWLLDLFGGVSLVFPLSDVRIGDKWQHQISVGLKPPNEPRRISVTYKLEGREIVDGRECLKISMSLFSPVKLAWEWKDASVVVTGGAKVEGTFWFDPSLGSIRLKRTALTTGYTVEFERWDGFQFVQTTKYVDQKTEVVGRLLSPK